MGKRKRSRPTTPPQAPDLEREHAALLAAIDADIEQRAKRHAVWLKEQEAVQHVNDLMERIYNGCRTLAEEHPKPPYLPDDDPPPFHVRMWADRVVALARDWVEYHGLMGESCLPVVSDEYGHHVARLIFGRACETLDVDGTEAWLVNDLKRLNQIGKKVPTLGDRWFEGTHGLGDYFGMVGFAFSNFGGNLWQFNGKPIPGRIVVGTQTVRAAPRGTRTEPVAVPPRKAPLKLSAEFVERIMKAIPADGSWIHGDQLLRRAGYNPGGRYGQFFGGMTRPDGPLESRKGKGKHKGYRLRPAGGRH
jgi:hypothetical protein